MLDNYQGRMIRVDGRWHSMPSDDNPKHLNTVWETSHTVLFLTSPSWLPVNHVQLAVLLTGAILFTFIYIYHPWQDPLLSADQSQPHGAAEHLPIWDASSDIDRYRYTINSFCSTLRLGESKWWPSITRVLTSNRSSDSFIIEWRNASLSELRFAVAGVHGGPQYLSKSTEW